MSTTRSTTKQNATLPQRTPASTTDNGQHTEVRSWGLAVLLVCPLIPLPARRATTTCHPPAGDSAMATATALATALALAPAAYHLRWLHRRLRMLAAGLAGFGYGYGYGFVFFIYLDAHGCSQKAKTIAKAVEP